jgi:uncharacterized tellurite resistance protein B-like protein
MIDAIRTFVKERILHPPEPVRMPAEGASPARAHPGVPGVELAACALLLELAHADGEFSPVERAHIENALTRHFGLEGGALQELMELAEAARRQSVDHFQFTRVIAEHYDLGQKMVLAEVMWGVILADGRIDDHEAYIIRKVAYLLELEPVYLSQARAAVTKQP